ncbi:MAG: glycosyltransferase family 1 protein, partial [Planctomycetota bacterium]
MRIAIVHSRFSYVGGAEKYIYFLVHRLLKDGHQIHYFCHYKEPFRHPLFHYHYIPMVKGIRFLKALSFAFATEMKVNQGDYDIVHGFYKTFRQDIYTDGSGLVELYQNYVLSQKQGLQRLLRKYSLYYQADKLLERLRFTPGNYRKVLCMSEMVKKQLQQEYHIPDNRITVLYNGIDCEFFHPRNKKKYGPSLRKELGIHEGEVLFTLIGNDYIRKNVITALKAFRELPRGKRGRLLVVGKDRRQKQYEEMAKKWGLEKEVIFLGPRRDIERIHSITDVFLLVSHYDVFGMVVLEAMATGVPCIVSSLAGASEIIQPGRNGWILEDPGSFQELAEKMSYFLSLSSKEKEDMDTMAREKALELDWQAHYSQLLAYYREIQEEKIKEGI